MFPPKMISVNVRLRIVQHARTFPGAVQCAQTRTCRPHKLKFYKQCFTGPEKDKNRPHRAIHYSAGSALPFSTEPTSLSPQSLIAPIQKEYHLQLNPRNGDSYRLLHLQFPHPLPKMWWLIMEPTRRLTCPPNFRLNFSGRFASQKHIHELHGCIRGFTPPSPPRHRDLLRVLPTVEQKQGLQSASPTRCKKGLRLLPGWVPPGIPTYLLLLPPRKLFLCHKSDVTLPGNPSRILCRGHLKAFGIVARKRFTNTPETRREHLWNELWERPRTRCGTP